MSSGDISPPVVGSAVAAGLGDGTGAGEAATTLGDDGLVGSALGAVAVAFPAVLAGDAGA